MMLCLSGAAIGVNWILLFEAYNYTSVATATLCYYRAPMFVILASPLVVGERLTARKLICVLAALLGMVFVSGVLETGGGSSDLKGVLLGLGAAVLYASVVLMNKQLGDVPAYDRSTIVQLGSSAAVLLPYVLLTEDVGALSFTPATLALLMVVGIVHTGMAYALYFGSLMELKAQTAAILSYIDPVVAVLLSALLLKEHMSLLSGLGAVLVLGAAIVSELPAQRGRLLKELCYSLICGKIGIFWYSQPVSPTDIHACICTRGGRFYIDRYHPNTERGTDQWVERHGFAPAFVCSQCLPCSAWVWRWRRAKRRHPN